MSVPSYFLKQEPGRKEILSSIHSIITQEDKTVDGSVGLMMGKEMILYKQKGYFKYGLASVKNYMTLHVMLIYGDSPLHSKYKTLLPKADFQKGCINFKTAEEMPLDIIRQLFNDCAKVDYAAMLSKYKKS
ncbi:MAG: hypothetical protein JWN76_223 [Chitinophagaceae bacterium]|nr:hypothetical protein [Chitinophagaceae bacterium]